jgi:hypothetical protein
VLKPLAGRPDARAEAVLRLGFAQALAKDPAAKATLERAYATAREPGDWRTRARAKYDLARLALQAGQKEQARALAAEAAKEGLVLAKAAPGDEALFALLPKPGPASHPKEAGPLGSP